MSQGFLIFAGGVRYSTLLKDCEVFKEDVVEIRVWQHCGKVFFLRPPEGQDFAIRKELYSNSVENSRLIVYLHRAGKKRMILGELQTTFLSDGAEKMVPHEKFVPNKCYELDGNNRFVRKRTKLAIVFY